MSNVVSSWSTPENLQKIDARILWKICEFVGEDLFFFVLLRLPEVFGKLANILSVDLFLGEHFRAVSLASSNPDLDL